jgi:hypothetical protein
MQPHPDRGELKLYLRGNAPAPVATVIKQHLMICDRCVGEALVVYDELDQARAVSTKRDTDIESPVTALIPAAQATINVGPQKSSWRYEWAALIPIALAAGLMWTTRMPVDTAHAVRARIATAMERQPVVSLPVQTEAGDENDSVNTPAVDSSSEAEIAEASAERVERRDSNPQLRETKIAKVFIFAAQPRPRHATDPVLLQPIDPVHVAFRTDTVQKSAALTLLTRESYLAPPPQRPAGLKKVFSVIAAPFRKS